MERFITIIVNTKTTNFGVKYFDNNIYTVFDKVKINDKDFYLCRNNDKYVTRIKCGSLIYMFLQTEINEADDIVQQLNIKNNLDKCDKKFFKSECIRKVDNYIMSIYDGMSPKSEKHKVLILSINRKINEFRESFLSTFDVNNVLAEYSENFKC